MPFPKGGRNERPSLPLSFPRQATFPRGSIHHYSEATHEPCTGSPSDVHEMKPDASRFFLSQQDRQQQGGQASVVFESWEYNDFMCVEKFEYI
jgi:hypothetical protein